MHPSPRLLLPVAAALVLAACAEDVSTGPQRPNLSPDMALTFPMGARDRLVVRQTTSSASGPARTEEFVDESDWDESMEMSAIWNERTRANFIPGALSVIGEHDYQGNKGAITTNAMLAFAGQTIGTQTAMTENYFPFVLDFGRVHSIWAWAPIYSDRECGLSGHGNSEHRAWWEAVIGGPISQYGQVTRTSTSDLVRQPECPSEPAPDYTLGGGGGSDGSADDAACYFWVEYDLRTGEIYDSQLLYCTEGG